jgi:uncharacterized protein YuzE
MKPHVRYSHQDDSLAIFLADSPSVESEEIVDNVVLAYDAADRVVGIEIVGGARELFADLIAQVAAESSAEGMLKLRSVAASARKRGTSRLQA